MSFFSYVQMDAIPIIALVLITILSHKEFPSEKNVNRYRTMVYFVIAVLFVDIVNWYFIVYPQKTSTNAMWLFNMLYFLLSELIAYSWFQYVFHEVYENRLNNRQKLISRLSIIPLIVICVFILTSPLEHSIFYIDAADNHYYRGNYHFLQELFGFGYMLAASYFAFFQSRKAQLSEQKNEYRFLAAVIIFPFIGGVLQILNFYLVFLWPLTAAAAFLIYVDFQKHHISEDALTGLNNRGSLERYLQKKERAKENDWYYIMIDVDRFKTINDKYGHIEGDRALRIVAQTLKNVFGRRNAFLSRFGGDEFAVIASYPSDEALDGIIEKCRKELKHQIAEHQLPYDMSLSFGYKQADLTDNMSAREIMRQADLAMYENKQNTNQKMK